MNNQIPFWYMYLVVVIGYVTGFACRNIEWKEKLVRRGLAEWCLNEHNRKCWCWKMANDGKPLSNRPATANQMRELLDRQDEMIKLLETIAELLKTLVERE